MNDFADIETPLGPVRIVCDDAAVIGVGFYPERNAKLAKIELSDRESTSGLCRDAARQLGEYFAGRRKKFDLPVSFGRISEFSDDILRSLAAIPYGEVLTYGTLAEISGHPKSARAVGRVMAANPVPIIVPCHRVVGANGKMVGYSGGDGISTKKWLLAFEADNRVT